MRREGIKAVKQLDRRSSEVGHIGIGEKVSSAKLSSAGAVVSPIVRDLTNFLAVWIQRRSSADDIEAQLEHFLRDCIAKLGSNLLLYISGNDDRIE